MSIRVTIEHPTGVFRRIIEIHNTEGIDTALKEQDDVFTYAARLLVSHGNSGLERGSEVQRIPYTEFRHRYGDDLLTLVSEAIDALGGRGGTELRR